MTPKEQTELLMNEMLAFAMKMLVEHGDFHPFGGYLTRDMRIVHVGVDGVGDFPPGSDVFDQLVFCFRRMSNDSAISAFSIVANVFLNSDENRGDAIRFSLEHRDSFSATVFFRYELDFGQPRVVRVFAQEGATNLFLNS